MGRVGVRLDGVRWDRVWWSGLEYGGEDQNADLRISISVAEDSLEAALAFAEGG